MCDRMCMCVDLNQCPHLPPRPHLTQVLTKADPAEAMVKSVLHPTEKQAAHMARKGHRFFRATLSKSVSGGGIWLVQADVEIPGGIYVGFRVGVSVFVIV